VATPETLARQLIAGDWEGAIETLRAGADLPAATLSAQGWSDLASACARRAEGALALLAFRRAAEIAPQGPLAPKALLQAARVAAEALGDARLSNELLSDLLRLYPGTAEADFAARRLRRG
jgi:hypothetical protein